MSRGAGKHELDTGLVLWYDANAKYCIYEASQMSCGERLSNALRLSGFRVTPQRAVILETIARILEKKEPDLPPATD